MTRRSQGTFRKESQATTGKKDPTDDEKKNTSAKGATAKINGGPPGVGDKPTCEEAPPFEERKNRLPNLCPNAERAKKRNRTFQRIKDVTGKRSSKGGALEQSANKPWGVDTQEMTAQSKASITRANQSISS